MKGLNPKVEIKKSSYLQDMKERFFSENPCSDCYYAMTITLAPIIHEKNSIEQVRFITKSIKKATRGHYKYLFSQEFTENGILHAHGVLTDFRGIKSFTNRIRATLGIGWVKLKKCFNLVKWASYLIKDVDETLSEFTESHWLVTEEPKKYNDYTKSFNGDYIIEDYDYLKLIRFLYFTHETNHQDVFNLPDLV